MVRARQTGFSLLEILVVVTIVVGEVAGMRFERYKSSPCAEGRFFAVVITLPASVRNAHPNRFARGPVVQEDIRLLVCISTHQVSRRGRKSNELSRRVYRGRPAVSTRLGPFAGKTDSRRFARLPVVNENILLSVGVMENEIGRF